MPTGDAAANLFNDIARCMGHVSGHETLLAFAHQHVVLKPVAVIHGAFAFEHMGDRLDTSVIMRLGNRAYRRCESTIQFAERTSGRRNGGL